jgi:hypothetical protein
MSKGQENSNCIGVDELRTTMSPSPSLEGQDPAPCECQQNQELTPATVLCMYSLAPYLHRMPPMRGRNVLADPADSGCHRQLVLSKVDMCSSKYIGEH